MVQKFSALVTFRWFEPVNGKAIEFTANTLAEFISAAENAAIDFRLVSRQLMGTSFLYRPGCLEVSLHQPEQPATQWLEPRVDQDSDAMRLPTRGTPVTADSAPSDVDIIKVSAPSWWLTIQNTIRQIHQTMTD